MKDTVSIILSGYKRPHILKEQFTSIENQTVKADEILFWKNKSEKNVAFDASVIIKTKAVESNYNFGVWARFAHALNCKSKYICIFDDDTIPGDMFLESCIKSCKEKPGLYGTIGLIYASSSTYMGAQRVGWDGINNEETKEVDIVGHAWFFERELLTSFWRELPDVEDFFVGEDMHFSHMIQKYTNLKTYVPPHPVNNKRVWGSLKGFQYGGDGVATGNFAIPLMDKFYKKIISRGFKIINS